MDLSGFIDRIVNLIIQPIIVLLVTAGVAYFIWGVSTYLWNSEKGGEDRKKGTQHILWGLVGLLIMVAVIGILQIITSTFRISLP